MSYRRIVISSGHGKYVPGAIGILDEHAEAVCVVDTLSAMLVERGVEVTTFEDTVSKTQNENLNRIVDFHNSQTRDLDVSIHFNAYVETDKQMGTECLYVTQSGLAREVADAVASCGFINRGPKCRTDLFFLNNTAMPAILIEVCFVDSEADARDVAAARDCHSGSLRDGVGIGRAVGAGAIWVSGSPGRLSEPNRIL
jgi:N-acetylmuramoyl-L-alanine amidase